VSTIYNFDPEKAKSLLDEAGWIDADGDGIREKDGVKFSFEFLYSEGSQTYVQLVPYMQQAWGEVGIEMTPVQMPFASLLDQVIAGNFQMAIAGFTWDVNGDQGVMFRSDGFPQAVADRAVQYHQRRCRGRDHVLLEVDQRIVAEASQFRPQRVRSALVTQLDLG
jgi:peptide/nickel transport system substrate-binding protein